MGFVDAAATCFQKYAAFGGRASRSEYWFWVLFYFLVVLLFTIVDEAVVGVSTGPFSTVATLALLLPSLAVGARRLHDIDRSGWWQLIALVPLIGAIVLIIWMCVPGTSGRNRFGPEPGYT
jgi:uncharacterized membrane protein YhaH (DUF805 family)